MKKEFSNELIVDLYITSIPDSSIKNVYPPKRQAQINSTANHSLRRQRYFVWKLLEYAVNKSFGLEFDKLNFSLEKNEKWHAEECFFSLSHTKSAIAVAVSNRPVGVDIENLNHPISDELCKKILTQTELNEYLSLSADERSRYLIKKWTAKESLFKLSEKRVFHPQKTETNIGVFSKTIKIAENPFCYSVATEYTEKIRTFTDIKLY